MSPEGPLPNVAKKKRNSGAQAIDVPAQMRHSTKGNPARSYPSFGTSGVNAKEERQQTNVSRRIPCTAHQPFYVVPIKDLICLSPNLSTTVTSSSVPPLGNAATVNSGPGATGANNNNNRVCTRYERNGQAWEQLYAASFVGTTCRPLILVGSVENQPSPHGPTSGVVVNKQDTQMPFKTLLPTGSAEVGTVHARNGIFLNGWSFPSPANAFDTPPLNSDEQTLSTTGHGVEGNSLNHSRQIPPLRPYTGGRTRPSTQPHSFHQWMMDLQRKNMSKLVYGPV